MYVYVSKGRLNIICTQYAKPVHNIPAQGPSYSLSNKKERVASGACLFVSGTKLGFALRLYVIPSFGKFTAFSSPLFACGTNTCGLSCLHYIPPMHMSAHAIGAAPKQIGIGRFTFCAPVTNYHTSWPCFSILTLLESVYGSVRVSCSRHRATQSFIPIAQLLSFSLSRSFFFSNSCSYI